MELKEEIVEIHERTSRSDSKDLAAAWREKEYWKGETKDVFSVIFRTRGCSWAYTSGCSMCGYYTDTNPDVGREEIEDQIEEASARYEGEEIVKIYTSGSFLDQKELPEDLAMNILETFDAEKLVVESRPEFIEREKVKQYAESSNRLEIAIGLESADDFILENCINKGFRYEDYERAVREISDLVLVRTYLLLKPPFLNEKEAIEDVISSVEKISDLTDIVSINPVNIQKGSLVEKLWKRNLYRPPWLWSIIEVLSNIKSDKTVLVSEAGLGSERGAHNCDGCDERLLKRIKRFNKTQNKEAIDPISDCECHERWKKEMQIEPFLFFRGSPKSLRNRYAGYI